MSAAVKSRPVSRLVDPRDELRDELRHVRNLVFVRDVLSAHGATAAELDEFDAVIGEARTQLAQAAKQLAAGA